MLIYIYYSSCYLSAFTGRPISAWSAKKSKGLSVSALNVALSIGDGGW